MNEPPALYDNDTVKGFNRYMVECESAYRGSGYYLPGGFNRYMVECELRTESGNRWNPESFNRYMVECEYGIYM